jgi:hypothetical protein
MAIDCVFCGRCILRALQALIYLNFMNTPEVHTVFIPISKDEKTEEEAESLILWFRCVTSALCQVERQNSTWILSKIAVLGLLLLSLPAPPSSRLSSLAFSFLFLFLLHFLGFTSNFLVRMNESYSGMGSDLPGASRQRQRMAVRDGTGK